MAGRRRLDGLGIYAYKGCSWKSGGSMSSAMATWARGARSPLKVSRSRGISDRACTQQSSIHKTRS